MRIVGAPMASTPFSSKSSARCARRSATGRSLACCFSPIAWVAWAALATAIMLVLSGGTTAGAAARGALRGLRGESRDRSQHRAHRRRLPAGGLRGASRGSGMGDRRAPNSRARYPATAGDPLFFWVFVAVVCANYLCVIVAAGGNRGSARPAPVRTPWTWRSLTAVHGAVLLRFVLARRALSGGRAGELERLRAVTRGWRARPHREKGKGRTRHTDPSRSRAADCGRRCRLLPGSAGRFGYRNRTTSVSKWMGQLAQFGV